MAFIYLITNIVNQKKYVGKTSLTIQERYERHILNSRYGDNTYLYKAIRKYGVSSFKIEELELCSDDIVEDRERYWISVLDTIIPNGYNMTEGGTGGDTSNSPNFIEAMKTMHEKRSPEDYATYGMKDKKHTSETLAKQSAAHKKRWESVSIEERSKRGDKISGSNNGMFGKTPKNSVQIIYNDVQYNSISAAVKSTGKSSHFLKKHGIIS